jgi:hypothetical protein
MSVKKQGMLTEGFEEIKIELREIERDVECSYSYLSNDTNT